MGTDIELFVEVDESEEYQKFDIEPFSNEKFIRCIAGDDIFIGRPYSLFHALANERNRDERKCLIQPKGIPEIVSLKIVSKYFWLVFDEPPKRPGLNWVSEEVAEKYVSEGRAYYRYSSYFKYDERSDRKLISHPEATGASHLTYDEVMNSLKHFEIDSTQLPGMFSIVISMLAAAEKAYGKNRARIVFWFLN